MELTEQADGSDERWFQGLIDSAPVLIWISGPDKQCTYFNQSWLKFTGRTLEQERGFGWADGVHPRDRQRIVDQYNKAFDVREPFVLEYLLRGHSGKYFHIWDTGVPRYSQDGKFIGYIGACADITARLVAEKRLRLQNAVTHILADSENLEVAAPAILDAIGYGLEWDQGIFWIADKQRKSLQSAGEWCRDGVKHEALHPGSGLVRNCLSSQKPIWLPDITQDSELSLESEPGGKEFRGAFVIPVVLNAEAVGALEFYSSAVYPADDAAMSLAESLGIQIGQFIEKTQSARSAREQDRRLMLMEQREDFLSALTHDLKGPLIGSNLTLQALMEGHWSPVADQQLPILAKLCESNERLIAKIRNLTDVFEFERELVDVTFQEVNLTALVNEVLNSFAAAAAARNIHLLTEGGPEDAIVEGHGGSLVRSLKNLLDNALNFSPDGGTITVRILREPNICLEVSDCGPGIPQEEIAKLFSRFWQGGVGHNYPPETGLGLYLCKRIAEAHNGTVSCLSEVGHGSTFRITLPPLDQASP